MSGGNPKKYERNPKNRRKSKNTALRLMTSTPGPTGARCAQPCLSWRRQVDCFRRKSRTNQEEIKNLQEELKKSGRNPKILVNDSHPNWRIEGPGVLNPVCLGDDRLIALSQATVWTIFGLVLVVEKKQKYVPCKIFL